MIYTASRTFNCGSSNMVVLGVDNLKALFELDRCKNKIAFLLCIKSFISDTVNPSWPVRLKSKFLKLITSPAFMWVEAIGFSIVVYR